MKNGTKKIRIVGLILLMVLMVSCSCVWAVENTGLGKPKGLDIYVNDVPYGASLGGAVKSGEKAVGDFNVIVNDAAPGKGDPDWFKELGGAAASPTPTPTMVPTPTTTIPIPVDKGGIGAKLCVADSTTDVIVDFAYSSASYKNEFYLIKPRYEQFGWSQGEMPNNRVGTDIGTKWNLGKFPVGTELIFANQATNNGVDVGLYQTGPASRNSDNYIHAAISLKNSTGTHHKYLVSFEDIMGLGNKPDYNDMEFYVSGDVTTACSAVNPGSGDSGGGAITPIYAGKICRCESNKDTCIAQFDYNNTAGQMTIPVRSKSLPWNEFTGSGWTSPTKQYHCQPEKFYVGAAKTNAPFWTSPFWNNIDWKLGHTHSAAASCTKYSSRDKPGDKNYIPSCTSLGIASYCNNTCSST